MSARHKSVGRQKDPEKRDRILAAARKVFLLRGFGAATIEAIASEAGVSKVTVYGHFGTLEALLHAVVLAEADSINSAISRPLVQSDTLIEDVINFGIHLLSTLRERNTLDFEHLVAARATQQPELVTAYFVSGRARGMELLAKLMRPDIGEKAVEAAEMLFALWSGGDQHRVLLGLRGPLSDDEIDCHVRFCVDVIGKAYSLDERK
ncbi:MAG: TetR/AcrR family transcriptional regulator [Pseudomonadota bacterium]